jgi:hypothetical protein
MAEEERTEQSPFRKEALEYITTPQPLNDLTQITFSLVWLSALALCLGIIAIILWLCFGSIATYIDGKGVLLTENTAAVYVSNLTAHSVQRGMPVVIKMASQKQPYQQITGQVAAATALVREEPATVVMIQLKNSNTHLFVRGSLIKARITIHRQTPLSLILSKAV